MLSMELVAVDLLVILVVQRIRLNRRLPKEKYSNDKFVWTKTKPYAEKIYF